MILHSAQPSLCCICFCSEFIWKHQLFCVSLEGNFAVICLVPDYYLGPTVCIAIVGTCNLGPTVCFALFGTSNRIGFRVYFNRISLNFVFVPVLCCHVGNGLLHTSDFD